MSHGPRSKTELRARVLAVLTVVLLWTAAACFFAHPALGHDRTQSYSSWQRTERGANVRLHFTELDLTYFPWSVLSPEERDRAATEYFPQALTMRSAAGPCTPLPPVRFLHPSPGRVIYEWTVQCPSPEDIRIQCDILFDLVPSHLHFARLRTAQGQEFEKVFHKNDRVWALAPLLSTGAHHAPTSALGYLWLGIEHIWSGYDHLAFVVALLLPAMRLGERIKVVTGFTIAHSMTLTLATLGLVRPDLPSTEALIGLSIALVAVENLWIHAGPAWNGPWAAFAILLATTIAAFAGAGQIPPMVLAGTTLFLGCHFAGIRRGLGATASRWGIAFLFGLIHGFGFASALAEVGMPEKNLAVALGAFNVGVELGQLAVVLSSWPLLQVLTRTRPAARQAVSDYASAIVLGLGVYWFVSRAYAS